MLTEKQIKNIAHKIAQLSKSGSVSQGKCQELIAKQLGYENFSALKSQVDEIQRKLDYLEFLGTLSEGDQDDIFLLLRDKRYREQNNASMNNIQAEGENYTFKFYHPFDNYDPRTEKVMNAMDRAIDEVEKTVERLAAKDKK